MEPTLKLNENDTMIRNNQTDVSLDSQPQREERGTLVDRKSDWSSKNISVVNGQGKSLPAVLYTAEYEIFEQTKERNPGKRMNVGVLYVASKNFQAIWLGEIPNEGIESFVFIETSGEIFACVLSLLRLRFEGNLFFTNRKDNDFVFSKSGLDEFFEKNFSVEKYENRFAPFDDIFDCFDVSFPWWKRYASNFGRIEIKRITAKDEIFCFEIENHSYPRKGKVWIDIKGRKILESEDISHLTKPEEKRELKTKNLSEWRQRKISVLSSSGDTALANVYSAEVQFIQTVTGEKLMETIRIFHANNTDENKFWIDMKPLMIESSNFHYIEVEGELIFCYFRMPSMRFVNTAIKIEKPDNKFTFNQETMDKLFSQSYTKHPNIPYKFSMKNVELRDYYGSDFFEVKPGFDEMGIKKITAEDGSFCFEIENPSNKRSGKVWIDVKNAMVVKAEETTTSPK